MRRRNASCICTVYTRPTRTFLPRLGDDACEVRPIGEGSRTAPARTSSAEHRRSSTGPADRRSVRESSARPEPREPGFPSHGSPSGSQSIQQSSPSALVPTLRLMAKKQRPTCSVSRSLTNTSAVAVASAPLCNLSSRSRRIVHSRFADTPSAPRRPPPWRAADEASDRGRSNVGLNPDLLRRNRGAPDQECRLYPRRGAAPRPLKGASYSSRAAQ